MGAGSTSRRKLLGPSVLIVTLSVATARCQWQDPQPVSRAAACASEGLDVTDPQWRISWTQYVGEGYLAEPLFISGDYLIVVTREEEADQDRVRSYSLQTGRETWSISQKFAGGQRAQTLVFTQEYIANSVFAEAITVFDTDSGQIVLALPAGYIFTMAIDEDQLYLHDYRGHIQAYKLPQGKVLWDIELPNAMRGGYLFTSERRLVVSLLTRVWVLNAESGEIRSQFEIGKGITPHAYEENILVQQEQSWLRTVSLVSGQVIWEKPYQPDPPDIIYLAPAYLSGVLYFPAKFGREIRAVSLQTGETAWWHPVEADLRIVSGITVSEEEAYAILSDGTLRAYDLETGDERILLRSNALAYQAPVGSVPLPVPSIAVMEDKVFAGFGCHTVYMLGRELH